MQAFMTLFSGTSPKTSAQVMAVALAIYVTDSNLAGTVATGQGFNVSLSATAAKLYNVGPNGAALGLPNNTWYSVQTLMQRANTLAPWSSSVRGALNVIFNGINTTGDRLWCVDLRAPHQVRVAAFSQQFG